MKRPVKKKPAAKKPTKEAQISRQVAHMVEAKMDRLFNLIDATRTAVTNSRMDERMLSSNLAHIVDQMGRSLSDQIHILFKEIRPSPPPDWQKRVLELERRMYLLETETTNLVKNAIKQVESRYQLEKKFRKQKSLAEAEHILEENQS